ncbi:MAG: SDR family oxidoreductase [Actinomycetota bacterium]
MSDRFSVQDKVILITGASYGLGEYFATELAKEGAQLVLTARTADLLEQTAASCRELGAKVTTAVGDVSNEDDVKAAVERAIDEHGRIDVLVNNAGIADMRGVPAESFDVETLNNIMNVDLVGAFIMARECGRRMLAAGSGSIINICSIMGSGANELNVIAYTTAKGALRNLTQQLGCEWADRGVRVNAISPGFMATEMTKAALEGLGVAEYVASRTPMRRIGDVEEMMGALLFLASDASSYVTGIDLLVDGGTNAGNGYYQLAPGHQDWGEKLDQGKVGEPFRGLVDLPERFDAWKLGVPGIHYPMPEGTEG